MSDALYKAVAGGAAMSSSNKDKDADHTVKHTYRLTVPYTLVGAVNMLIPICTLQTAIVVKKLRCSFSVALTSGANEPEFDLVSDDGANTAEVVVGEFVDASTTSLAIDTWRDVDITPANGAVASGRRLCLRVEGNGTPAVGPDAGSFVCFEVLYDLAG